MTPDDIARTCHEVNRAYCAALGDHSQPAWADAPEWQRASARMGVDLHTMGNFGPESSHISWMRQKEAEGWVYGPVKDPQAKEHPCMVPFDLLPVAQQAKDFIFRAVVHALRGAAPTGQQLATKVTLQGIKDKIKGITYTLLPNSRTTVCQLTLANGFTIEGQSACVSIENYNQVLGENYAYEDALNNCWKFEGYLLAERLHAASINPAEED